MPFRFKQFYIDDQGCGMPVSTDGVLLGAWAETLPIDANQPPKILDIGAGSGLLSLMAAQRNPLAQITAVEIDPQAAAVCQRNIDASPWASRIQVQQTDICLFAEQLDQQQPRYQQILCNPPYFVSGPQSNSSNRAQARHTDSLSFIELCQAIAQLLEEQGSAHLILPTQSWAQFRKALQQVPELSIIRLCHVQQVPHKPAQRLLFSLQKNQHPQASVVAETQLEIYDQHNQYTPAMIALTQDFYLKL